MPDSKEDTVEACLARIKAAWDAGDAERYAAEFTDDATYVIFLGDALTGRAEIAANHVDVFGKWQKGTKMAVKPLNIRPLGGDAALALTIGGLGTAEPIRYDKLQTFAFVRRDGRWACSAFHNTRMSPQTQSAFNCE